MKDPKAIKLKDLEPKPSNRNYSSPRLEKLGDIRSLTLGISGGTGESGTSTTHYTFGMPPQP